MVSGMCTSWVCCSAGGTKLDCEPSLRSPRRPPRGARQPARARVAAARLERGALLGSVVGPAGAELLGLDLLLVARLGGTGRCRRGGARRGLGLVDGALDGFLAGLGLGFFGLLRDQGLLGRRHHGPDGRGLGFGGLAAALQVGLAGVVLGRLVGGLDDTQHRLGRLGRLGRGLGLRRFGRRGGDVGGGDRCTGSCGGGGRGSRGGGFGRCLRGRFGRRLGGGFGRGGRGGFGRFAGRAFLFLALAPLFGQLFFLLADGVGLGARFFLAPLQVQFLGTGAGHRFAAGGVVALDEDPLLAHFHLDGARLAAGVGLLDLGGRLARQRDLLALGAAGAVRGAQEVEQALLVRFGQGVVWRKLGDAGRLQLLEQRRRRAVQLLRELGYGGHGHVAVFLG